jgi:hypothetical protein
VPNIPEETIQKIRNTKIERFNNIIQAMKKHKLLDGLGEDIYKNLDRLRELRNRIHIQFDVNQQTSIATIRRRLRLQPLLRA